MLEYGAQSQPPVPFASGSGEGRFLSVSFESSCSLPLSSDRNLTGHEPPVDTNGRVKDDGELARGALRRRRGKRNDVAEKLVARVEQSLAVEQDLRVHFDPIKDEVVLRRLVLEASTSMTQTSASGELEFVRPHVVLPERGIVEKVELKERIRDDTLALEVGDEVL